MTYFRASLGVLAAGALSACGGGAGGAFFGSASSALNYTPEYSGGPGDTVVASLTEGGATGTIVLADALGNDVEFASLKVRLSPDRMTAYVTIGGTTMVMAADPDTVEPGGGLYGDADNPAVPTMTLSNLATYSLVGFTEDTIGGFGYAGIETPTANLPVGDVVFSGFWGGTIYPNLDGVGPGFDPDDLPLLGGGVASGFVEMTLNFDTGDLAGTFDGDFNDFGGVTETGGTITGSTQGNGITGSFNFDGGAYSGSAGFAGKAYGDSADSINGVMGSTLINNATGKPHAFGGTFDLEPGGF